MARLIVWGGTLGLVGAQLGFDTSSVFAWLSVGGITIGFAVQGCLTDLIAAVTIFVDRPFQVGDWISLRTGESGQVKWIGLRSTKLRVRDIGQTITIPNHMIAASIVTNYTVHLDEDVLLRQADASHDYRDRESQSFHLAAVERFSCVELILELSTPTAILAALPDQIRAAIELQPEVSDHVVFEGCHISQITSKGLVLDIKFTINLSDFGQYKDKKHMMFLKMLQVIQNSGARLVEEHRWHVEDNKSAKSAATDS